MLSVKNAYLIAVPTHSGHKKLDFRKKKGPAMVGLVEGLKSLINFPPLPEIWAITNERISMV